MGTSSQELKTVEGLLKKKKDRDKQQSNHLELYLVVRPSGQLQSADLSNIFINK